MKSGGMSVGRADPPKKEKKWDEEEDGTKKEVLKIKSYSDVMKRKLDKLGTKKMVMMMIYLQDDGKP